MNNYRITKMIGFFAVILLFGISSAWGAKPAVKLYVDASASAGGDGTSWETAFTDLQDALDAAVFGDEIWVAAGTYKPTDTSDRSVSFVLKSGVALYGGFAGGEKFLLERSLDPSLTVLSGDIGTKGDDTDNSFHVVYADGVTGAVLDGFTVTLGRGDDVSVGPWATFAGAGMYNTNSALTVSNCIFSHNKVAVGTIGSSGIGQGGGMYNKDSAPIVTNCIFSDNQAGNVGFNKFGAGGAMYNEGYFDDGLNDQFPVITGCTFSDNVASSGYNITQEGGGGIYNAGVSATIDRCIFVRNLAGCGGGMLNYGGMPTITNCIFDTNSNSYSEGRGGAIYNYAYGATILNCTFYQNGWRLFTSGTEPHFRPYTRDGGAVYNYRGGPTIFNCIFSNNAVRGRGGAVVSDPPAYTSNMGTKLTNCLFYKNFSWEGSDPGNEVISHLNGKFHPDSANNFYDIDPLLVDPEGGDFHLSYSSPCIDTGYALTFGYLPYPIPKGLPDTDFEGDKRIVDSDGDGAPAIDIGVDEFIPNLPDLRAFIEDLADSGELDESTKARLLVYVDDAQASLGQDEKKTAIRILKDMIADAWASLDDNEIAQAIEMKTQAVIEVI